MLCVDEWCNSSDVTTVGNKNKLKQLNPYTHRGHVWEASSTTTTTTTIFRPFFRDHPGEPVPEENFWTLWCKGRSTNHPAGHHSIRTNQCPYLHPPIFYRPDALPATQPTVSKHWRQLVQLEASSSVSVSKDICRKLAVKRPYFSLHSVLVWGFKFCCHI